MNPFCVIESWVIREAGFWILMRRKGENLGQMLVRICEGSWGKAEVSSPL